MIATPPPLPAGPFDTPPVGFMRSEAQAVLLREILDEAGVQRGVYDERMVAWVASWDWATFASIAAWIRQAGRE